MTDSIGPINDTKTWLTNIQEGEILTNLGKASKVDAEILRSILGSLQHRDFGSQADRKAREVFRTAVDKSGLGGGELATIVGSLIFFATNLPHNLQVENAIELLVDEGLLTSDDGAALKQRLVDLLAHGGFEAMCEIDREVERETEDDQLSNVAVPRLEGMWTRCIQIPMFTPGYTIIDDPTDYSPSIERYASYAVLQMDIDVFGDTQRISIALNERELSQMITELNFLQKQLMAMRTSAARKEE